MYHTPPLQCAALTVTLAAREDGMGRYTWFRVQGLGIR